MFKGGVAGSTSCSKMRQYDYLGNPRLLEIARLLR